MISTTTERMVIITGASSGIGEACAEVFAQAGNNLFLLARREERLAALKKKLEKAHAVTVHFAGLDIQNKKAIQALVRKQSDVFEKTTVLVNNAGMARGMETIQEGNSDDWDAMWDTNVKGLLYITREILPFFVARKSGHIVNMGSVASRWAYPKGNIYSATKRAVSALTESLRLDLLGTGVRVTEIAPGMVETEFSVVRLGDERKAKAVYQGMQPLHAKDVAEAVLWATSRPAHVNVQELVLYPTDQASTNFVYRR